MGIVAAMWKPSEAVQQRHSDVEAQPMGIGVSIFLLAVGAILTFAVEAEVAGIDLDVVGLILMAVGALGLVMTLLVWGPRRRVAASSAPLCRNARSWKSGVSTTIPRCSPRNLACWARICAC